MFDLSLMGRLSFKLTPPSPPIPPAFPPGRNRLGIAEERDAILYVPATLNTSKPIPLLIMFHGAGGFPEKVLPFLEEHAERHGFLLLAPHSTYATWDIVVGGHGPIWNGWTRNWRRLPHATQSIRNGSVSPASPTAPAMPFPPA